MPTESNSHKAVEANAKVKAALATGKLSDNPYRYDTPEYALWEQTFRANCNTK